MSRAGLLPVDAQRVFDVQDARVREASGETVSATAVNSVAIGAGLEGLLRGEGIGHLVIQGATTNHRVGTATRMAGRLGFDARLAEDACRTCDRSGPDGRVLRAADVHAMTLARLHGEFACIVSAGEAARILSR